MKSKEFARVLAALADVSDFARSKELLCMARFFESGASETMFARLKRLHPSRSHPATLKKSLATLQTILIAAGAKKPAHTVALVIDLCAGRANGNVDSFLDEITMGASQDQRSVGRLVDIQIANEILARLNQAIIDRTPIDNILSALRDREINIPTLAHIARTFLQSSAAYRDRKSAVNDIARHHQRQSALPTNFDKNRHG